MFQAQITMAIGQPSHPPVGLEQIKRRCRRRAMARKLVEQPVHGLRNRGFALKRGLLAQIAVYKPRKAPQAERRLGAPGVIGMESGYSLAPRASQLRPSATPLLQLGPSGWWLESKRRITTMLRADRVAQFGDPR